MNVEQFALIGINVAVAFVVLCLLARVVGYNFCAGMIQYYLDHQEDSDDEKHEKSQ